MTHLDPTGDHHDQPAGDPLTQLARDVRTSAREAVDAIHHLNHLIDAAPPLPAPEVYATLVDLEDLGYRLAHALRHLGIGLQRSLDTYEVTQDDGTDPAAAVDVSIFELRQAVADATDLGVRIGRARNAIASQGHRGRRTPTTTEED